MITTQFSIRSLACGGLALAGWMLVSCASTRVTSITKEKSFDARTMRRVLVIGVVRKPTTQRMLEEEFVRNLKERGSEGVSSYTLVPESTKLDRDAWKRVVADNHFDAVIVSRLVDMEVVEKDVEAKYVQTPNAMGSYGGYGYYSSGYGYVYQPGYSYRKETAAVETRVFEAAGEKQVWSGQSKTDIVEGREPEAQIRDFVSHMVGQIYH